MEKNENITQGQDTHVGYGRNRGDGSDSQNQQPVDSLQRYADQSDAFFDKVTDSTLSVSDIKEQLGISTESMFGGISKDVYKKVLSENSNIMFGKAPPQFKDALNALVSKRSVQCYVGETDDGRCYYNAVWNSVFMTKDFFMNNGSPYQDFWEVLLHEYSHAIDYNLGSSDAWTPSSAAVRLQSAGGMTLLEDAFDELGGDEMYAEYEELIKENAESSRRNEELVRLSHQKDDDYQMSMDIAVNAICSKYGYNRAAVERALESTGLPNMDDDDLEFALAFVDDDLREGIDAWYKDDSFKGERERSKEFADRYVEDGRALIEKFNGGKDEAFEMEMRDWKEFSALNDIMSSVNGGRDHPIFGYGHDSEYYGSDNNRATEIFAEIGPILAKNGKAAEWLKKKAPKLVAGYYELLGLALNKFKER